MIWRQGLHVPYNVYEGDRPICQTHTAMDARRICAAMNHSDGADILEDILAAVQQQGDAVEIWNRALDALFASLPVNAFYSRAFLMEKLNDLKTADLLTMPVGPAIIPPGTVPPKPAPTNAPALSSHFLKPEDEFARGLARDMAERHNARQPQPMPPDEDDARNVSGEDNWCPAVGCWKLFGHADDHADRMNGICTGREDACCLDKNHEGQCSAFPDSKRPVETVPAAAVDLALTDDDIPF